jgi:hypothetical protein
MLSCLIFVHELNHSNKIYLNLLNLNRNIKVYYNILGTDIIYEKKKKIYIDNVNNILNNLNIDVIIISINDTYIDKMNKLINELKINKVLNCFTNISIKLNKHNTEYLRLYNSNEIKYIYKTLENNISSSANINTNNTNNTNNSNTTTDNPKYIKNNKDEKSPLTPKKISKELNIFAELCMSFFEYLEDVQNKKISKNSNYEAVYIEFREFNHSEFIIKNCIIKLDEKWSHTVICCNDNYDFTINMCNRINTNIKVIKLDINNATYNDYNNLLFTKDFWNMLNGEKILIYQSDSLIFNSNINDFLHYDYIGTPFINNSVILAKNPVGNGGLSLRSKKAMLDVLDNSKFDRKYSKIAERYRLANKLDNIPEDVFYSQNIQNLNLGLVPDKGVGELFGLIYNKCEDSFGMHAMWHLCPRWNSILKIYMENSIMNKNRKDNTNNIRQDNTNRKDNTNNIREDELYLNKMDEFCKIMNIIKKDVLINPKQEFRYFCYRYMDYIKMLNLPTIQIDEIYESVLIEFRCLPHLEFLIRNTIHKLGKNWSHTVVCGINNYDFINNIVKDINRNIKIIKLPYENLTQIEYNGLLLTSDFWKLFNGVKLLIYQEDSCIFKSNINDFIKWDYIGAPWPLDYGINKSGVGNGGFSLRSKSVMLECLKYESSIDIPKRVTEYMIENKLKRIPEDVLFSNIIEKYNIGQIADYNTATKFSSESIINPDSLGGHQFWLNNVNWKNYLYSNVIRKFIPTHMKMLEHRGGWMNVINCLYDLNFYNKNSDVVFYDIVEKAFLWEKTKINKPWFGIVHCTENTPPYLECVNTSNLFNSNSHFLKNIKNCLFLIGLSPNVVDYLKLKFNELNIKIDVYLLKHPIDFEENIPLFSIDKYIKNDNKKIIQIGQQLRKMTSIYKLNITDHTKLWLTGTKNFKNITNLFHKEKKYLNVQNIDINDIEMKYTNTFEEYDNLLSENIVFIDLFDAAANNTILECILRRTPIIVNKLPATIYYLGEDYPLFFNNIDDIPNLLNIKNIEKAHIYLDNIKLTDTKEFISNIVNILDYKLK